MSFQARLVIGSTLGGLASIAGGGKFANGAMTGAFGYLFNEIAGCFERGYCNIQVKGDYAIYQAAIDYLRQDPTMAAVIDDLTASSTTYTVAVNSSGDDRYDPRNTTIHWDPNSALYTTSGGTQTPALGLGHEMAHADASSLMYALRQLIPFGVYDTLEEYRVIQYYETPAAITLGEGVRYDHRGTPYNVSGPTQR
jgi:hypothetical protein